MSDFSEKIKTIGFVGHNCSKAIVHRGQEINNIKEFEKVTGKVYIDSNDHDQEIKFQQKAKDESIKRQFTKTADKILNEAISRGIQIDTPDRLDFIPGEIPE